MSTTGNVTRETTLHVRDHCLCLHTQRAARALARRFDEALKELGLNNGQFSLMMALNRPEPPAIGQLAEFLAMDRTTLTAKLKPLERRGLVKVTPDKKDRRTRRLQLTGEGGKVLAGAVPIWQREHDILDKELGQVVSDRLRPDLAILSGAPQSRSNLSQAPAAARGIGAKGPARDTPSSSS